MCLPIYRASLSQMVPYPLFCALLLTRAHSSALYIGNRASLTDSVVKKVQLRLVNLRRLKKLILAPKTLTHFYRCTIESILSGCITAWYGNCTARNHSGSPEGGEVCPKHHRGHTACPPRHLQHPMSQEGQKDHQGHQPPELRPVHPATIQKTRSVQVYQS